MKQYIGTKLIEAEPAYRAQKGNGNFTITDDPAKVFPNYPDVEDGYRVRYPDGYESWSPKETFEKAYLPLSTNGDLKNRQPEHQRRDGGQFHSRDVDTDRRGQNDHRSGAAPKRI